MEEHELQHFKDMLLDHENAMRKEQQSKAERVAKRHSQKYGPRKKSTAGTDDADEDVDAEDGEDAAKAKASSDKKPASASKKRKKGADDQTSDKVSLIFPTRLRKA